jgi:uncharacterized membrane protein
VELSQREEVMEASFALFADNVALGLEFLTVVAVLVGAAIALIEIVRRVIVQRNPMNASIRQVWIRFAAWILIALEFALGADIVRTAIAPTWDQIGQLGVIAAIRTGLGYFLDRDFEGLRKLGSEKPGKAERPE